MALRQRFEFGDARVLEQQAAAARLDLLQPRRHLDALVHRLGRAVQPGAPFDGFRAGLLGVRHGKADALDGRAVGLPIVDAELAFDLQCRIEHALAGHDLAAADVVRCPVADDGHLVAFVQQPKGQRQAGLATAHNRDSTHESSP